jgi:hypothetical protein
MQQLFHDNTTFVVALPSSIHYSPPLAKVIDSTEDASTSKPTTCETMQKLICTPFTYSVPSWWPTFKGDIAGNYLGRKPANAQTLRRFIASNGCPKDARILTVGNAYESQWIAK